MLKLCVWSLKHFSNFLQILYSYFLAAVLQDCCLSPDKHTVENEDRAEKRTCREML